MSELKAYIAPTADGTGLAEYYLKSEADKFIAEKDAKILALDAEVFKQKHHAELFLDERNYAETQLRHSNRKRCLAMANWCFDEGKGTPTVYEVRTFYWGRWGNIWLALAEEPTWAKFLQLIHKEAK